MPFQDFELDFRKGKRDEASRHLDEKRRVLDAASEHRKLLKSMYDQKLDFLKTRIPYLKETIAYYRQQSQEAYGNRDGAGARDWSNQAKALKPELDEAYNDKNRMLEELKAASERFRTALDEFRAAQADFNKARDSFNERLNYLKEESARKRAEREAEQQRREERKRNQESQVPMLVDRAKSELELKIQQWREDAARRDETGRRAGRQFQEPNVKVINGYSRDHDVYTTDIIIFQPGLSEHLHIVFDEYGNELVNEWRPNH